MTTTTYSVEGMTCGHCKMAVEKEVGAIEGVTSVEASVEAKNVTVTGDNVSVDDVAAAVEEAGYTLVK
ncbi:heavy-metal-associated domain-containing protein [Corynebacterium pyruviciproducens]|uniref:Copper ion binding protein n=1 Tax=Corynebacterium pyruviciproducens TaxID=598660 RepID=A0AAF1BW13_9CORY|nr:copper ion binding protein [Corynebacterium pyruviciproducens]MDH4659147.1 heavy-metal-associated domain-containing protein [Corynebacterium pyruviciproducens]MDK6567061.1 copper ion binding protein [Corynebacterium pyruviciproducens]MDK7215316.1 copper ion binding protein [Corynebacterium pyruviciproducens]WOT01371.1 copper ion binding protein [Corynebacterium pyruviciproducens]